MSGQPSPLAAVDSTRDPLPTVRDAVIELLRSFGMTTIFGNPGSTELALFLNFPEDFSYQLGLQEAVVVGMADGYAQATRKAAFVNLHSAAGVGNAMGAIFTAYKNATPLVISAGQQARAILPYDPFLSSSDATHLAMPYVKYSIEPARAEDVPQAIARAYYMATQAPCGPVLVSIPADDWNRPCDFIPQPRIVSTSSSPHPDILAQVVQLLDTCQRPVFVVGTGVDRDAAWEETVQLAERHSAPVWIAPMSARCGFPGDHPLFAGYLAAEREKIVGALGGHDGIFVIGAPAFTYHVEGSGPYLPPDAKLAQLIDDPAIASWAPAGTAMVCGIKAGMAALLQASTPPKRPLPVPRQKAPRAEPSTPMSVAYFLQTLDEVRSPDTVIVEESPSARPVMHRYMPIYQSETFYTMASGGLGYGLPAAVGVALGKPGKRIIGLVGDGSSMYSLQALWNAVQLKLPITFIIVNNQRYAALQEFAHTFGFKPGEYLQGSELPGLDFVSLAKGMGCDALRVEDPAVLAETLRSALQSQGPILVEVRVK